MPNGYNLSQWFSNQVMLLSVAYKLALEPIALLDTDVEVFVRAPHVVAPRSPVQLTRKADRSVGHAPRTIHGPNLPLKEIVEEHVGEAQRNAELDRLVVHVLGVLLVAARHDGLHVAAGDSVGGHDD